MACQRGSIIPKRSETRRSLVAAIEHGRPRRKAGGRGAQHPRGIAGTGDGQAGHQWLHTARGGGCIGVR
jgi:hypothetical protein